MGARTGKHMDNDNEINRKQNRRKFGFSTTRRREANLIGKDEQKKAASSTTMYNLPLEMLDIILQKSYLHWILNSSTKQRDKEVIWSLKSVDVCFNRRISRKRFKKAIWRYLKDFYGKTKKRSAIIRNNRKYLLENIQPNDEIIASLLSLNCITEEKSHVIQRQRSKRSKNAVLLYVVESFDETKFSNFAKCLRRTNQKTVARIIENGGGVIKVNVQTRDPKCTTSVLTQLLHEKIEDLRNRTKSRSLQTDKLISQLWKNGIEILNSQMDRQTLVVWIWCHSQAALEYLQRLYESNELRDVFFEKIQPSTLKTVNIDRIHFNKAAVMTLFPISINFTHRIDLAEHGLVSPWGVTKLGNEIYVICISYQNVISVFEDQDLFHLEKTIEIKEIKFPVDIVSCEKENCLYIADNEEKCIWKITKETDDQHNITKWLTTDYDLSTLSMLNDGQLMVNSSSSILMLYGSNAELIRLIQLPRDIEISRHAVETSIGNFIILHCWDEKENKRQSVSSGRKRQIQWGISEVTRDGQMVIRRFIPSNETQKLNEPRYLSIDSDDRVFVAGEGNQRVILLDSNLKWNRILCPTGEEVEEGTKFQQPLRLYYDKENKQLIVAGDGVNVYTLSGN